MEHDTEQRAPTAPPVAAAVFGSMLPAAERYAEMLASAGVDRGVIGPREAGRLWDRHLLNSAVLAELVPTSARVVDVGSGAGLPGIPLALARPDLVVTLLEPMQRRVRWLEEVVAELRLPVRVHRGRAEEGRMWSEGDTWDVAIARAVAPLGRLAAFCLPLVRPGGLLLALKGTSAEDELARDREQIRRAGAVWMEVVDCGTELGERFATAVLLTRRGATTEPSRRRKD